MAKGNKGGKGALTRAISQAQQAVIQATAQKEKAIKKENERKKKAIDTRLVIDKKIEIQKEVAEQIRAEELKAAAEQAAIDAEEEEATDALKERAEEDQSEIPEEDDTAQQLAEADAKRVAKSAKEAAEANQAKTKAEADQKLAQAKDKHEKAKAATAVAKTAVDDAKKIRDEKEAIVDQAQKVLQQVEEAIQEPAAILIQAAFRAKLAAIRAKKHGPVIISEGLSVKEAMASFKGVREERNERRAAVEVANSEFATATGVYNKAAEHLEACRAEEAEALSGVKVAEVQRAAFGNPVVDPIAAERSKRGAAREKSAEMSRSDLSISSMTVVHTSNKSLENNQELSAPKKGYNS